MNTYLLMFVSGAYMWTAYGYWQMGKPGMAMAFGAYAVANLGFIWDLKP